MESGSELLRTPSSDVTLMSSTTSLVIPYVENIELVIVSLAIDLLNVLSVPGIKSCFYTLLLVLMSLVGRMF